MVVHGAPLQFRLKKRTEEHERPLGLTATTLHHRYGGWVGGLDWGEGVMRGCNGGLGWDVLSSNCCFNY